MADASKSSIRILVVDDDASVRGLLEAYLVDAGYVVATAEDGPEVLDHVRRSVPSLILLDVDLPTMSGLEVLRRLRTEHGPADLPIIVVSTQSASTQIVRALELGANDFVAKPLDPQAILVRTANQLRLGSLQWRRSRELAASGLLVRASRPALAAAYCPMCRTLASADAPQCVQCGLARPPHGWDDPVLAGFTRLGQWIEDRYILDRFLGSGAVATVYRARDTVMDRQVAMKIIELDETKPAAQLAAELGALRKEILLASALPSPHLIQVFDVMSLSRDTLVIAMEYVDGETYKEKLQREGKQTVEDAFAVIRQVALAVAAAHREGVIHRDIKPSNIMIERLPDGQLFVRLADFGLAHAVDEQNEAGLFFGTPAFCSPEQARGLAEIDTRADIYSIGCVLYRALVGIAPYTGKLATVLLGHIHSPIPPVAPHLTSVDSELALKVEALVHRCMAKRPRDRFDNVNEFLRSCSELGG